MVIFRVIRRNNREQELTLKVGAIVLRCSRMQVSISGYIVLMPAMFVMEQSLNCFPGVLIQGGSKFKQVR